MEAAPRRGGAERSAFDGDGGMADAPLRAAARWGDDGPADFGWGFDRPIAGIEATTPIRSAPARCAEPE